MNLLEKMDFYQKLRNEGIDNFESKINRITGRETRAKFLELNF